MAKMIPNYFHFAQIQKLTEKRPKKNSLTDN